MAVYENLAIHDIQDAADTLRPVYDRTKQARWLRQPGSLAVPGARHAGHHRGCPAAVESRESRQPDGESPGDREGIPAIQQLHQRRHQHQRHSAVRAGNVRKGGEGVHRRLEDHAASGGDPSKIASVASFFISRIDSMVDAISEG